MIEPAIVVVRLVQYAAAVVLGGLPVFCLYAAPRWWPRRMLIAAAAILAAASLLSIVLQSMLFAGSAEGGLATGALGDIVTLLPLGKAAALRCLLALAAVLVLMLDRRGRARPALAAIGLAAAGSLAWLGHAGAGESALHLAADLVHVLAATAWLGALAGLVLMTLGKPKPGEMPHALAAFSRVGVAVVALLVASGVVNTWYLAGTEAVLHPLATPYTRWLAIKLALFAAMLPLAAWHRYRSNASNGTTRRTLGLEAALGLAVLGAVALLGTLEPPLG